MTACRRCRICRQKLRFEKAPRNRGQSRAERRADIYFRPRARPRREDAVICDFAETYHVLDLRALALPLAATLAAGLAPDSRIMRKLSGSAVPVSTLLQASAADSLAFLCWAQTEDGVKNRNRPQSILAALTGRGAEEKPRSIRTFADGAAFDAARARILENINVD